MTQYVQEKVEKLEQPITAWAILAVIGVLLCAYAFFIHATISNIVATKNLQSQVSSLTSSVSNLESKYMALKSDITVDGALAMGFSQPKTDAVYISRVAANSLSFNR